MSEDNKKAEQEQPTAPGAGDAAASAMKLDKFDSDAESVESEVEEIIDETPETGEAALQARISQLQADLSAKEDQHLRAVAEVQNIRRRAERDRRDAEQFGGAKLARDVLPVFDNLDEALRQAGPELKENAAAFFNGVELTRKVLLDALAKHQILPINPEAGEKFDPNQHQAMFEAPAPGVAPGSVVQVVQVGFMIADRLLRPAMVGVASAASAGAGAAAQPAKTESDDTDDGAPGEESQAAKA